jgi:hypothetical protein
MSSCQNPGKPEKRPRALNPSQAAKTTQARKTYGRAFSQDITLQYASARTLRAVGGAAIGSWPETSFGSCSGEERGIESCCSGEERGIES